VVAVIQQHTQREKEGRRWKRREGKAEGVERGERREGGGGGCCNTATYSTGEGGATMERQRGEKGERREGGGGGCCNTHTQREKEALAVDGERTNNYAIIKLFWKLLAHY